MAVVSIVTVIHTEHTVKTVGMVSLYPFHRQHSQTLIHITTSGAGSGAWALKPDAWFQIPILTNLSCTNGQITLFLCASVSLSENGNNNIGEDEIIRKGLN